VKFKAVRRQIPASHQKGSQGAAEENQTPATGDLKCSIAFRFVLGQTFVSLSGNSSERALFQRAFVEPLLTAKLWQS
jgi:hypothetical protein